MGSGRRTPELRRGSLLAALLLGAGAWCLAGEEKAWSAAAADSVPVVREARYRISAAVRPLLLFWIRTDNVGGARILWRSDGDGRRGYELLIGSDPRRAPRRINHWGWEREDAGPEGARLQGLKTEEESPDDARSAFARDGRDSFLYKAIRSHAAGGEVRAENTRWRLPRDYSYHDLGELLALTAAPGPEPPHVREARVPEDARPGLLFALADLVDEAVAAATGPSRRMLSGRALSFTFNTALYELRLLSTEWLDAASFGGRRYERLLRLTFEERDKEQKSPERFALVCATEGPLARMPVHVEYQPKWWFKVEGVLDDSEVFP